MAHLKAASFDKALADADIAILSSSASEKAPFRKAQALYGRPDSANAATSSRCSAPSTPATPPRRTSSAGLSLDSPRKPMVDTTSRPCTPKLPSCAPLTSITPPLLAPLLSGHRDLVVGGVGSSRRQLSLPAIFCCARRPLRTLCRRVQPAEDAQRDNPHRHSHRQHVHGRPGRTHRPPRPQTPPKPFSLQSHHGPPPRGLQPRRNHLGRRLPRR